MRIRGSSPRRFQGGGINLPAWAQGTPATSSLAALPAGVPTPMVNPGAGAQTPTMTGIAGGAPGGMANQSAAAAGLPALRAAYLAQMMGGMGGGAPAGMPTPMMNPGAGAPMPSMTGITGGAPGSTLNQAAMPNPALQQAAMRAQLARLRPQMPMPVTPGAGGMAPIANPGLAAALAQNPALQGLGGGAGFARGGKVGKRDRQFGESVEEPKSTKLARGGGVKIRRPKPKAAAAPKKAVPTPSPYDFEQDEGTAPASGPSLAPTPLPSGPGGTPPLAGPGMAKGGNFIQKAIKHPGALHKQLGVAQGKKIPAGKLAKAAKAPGKLGQRARFAETLKGLHKAKGGVCKDCGKAHGGVCKMAAGGAAKQRKGFPNTLPPPKRGAPKAAAGYAGGGKIRGCGVATKGCNFSGIF